MSERNMRCAICCRKKGKLDTALRDVQQRRLIQSLKRKLQSRIVLTRAMCQSRSDVKGSGGRHRKFGAEVSKYLW